jgi:hypothetical protein
MLVTVFYATGQSATMFWKFTRVSNSNICIRDVFKILASLMPRALVIILRLIRSITFLRLRLR